MCTTHETQFETSSEVSQHKEAHRSTVRSSARKHTEALWEDHHIVTHILETKYDGNEAFKGGFNRDSR